LENIFFELTYISKRPSEKGFNSSADIRCLNSTNIFCVRLTA
jgi:hypothetical protein